MENPTRSDFFVMMVNVGFGYVVASSGWFRYVSISSIYTAR